MIRSAVPRSAYQLKDAPNPSLNWDKREAEADGSVPEVVGADVPLRGTAAPGAFDPAAAPEHA